MRVASSLRSSALSDCVCGGWAGGGGKKGGRKGKKGKAKKAKELTVDDVLADHPDL